MPRNLILLCETDVRRLEDHRARNSAPDRGNRVERRAGQDGPTYFCGIPVRVDARFPAGTVAILSYLDEGKPTARVEVTGTGPAGPFHFTMLGKTRNP